VKPSALEYHAPRAEEEVVGLLAEWGDDGKVLAGGQSLVPLLSLRLAAPAHIIDINRVPELDRMTIDGGELCIGALVRQADAEHSPVVRDACRVLSEALPHVAHVAIRNRGTVCGSLAHCDPAAEVPLIFATLGGTAVVRSVRGTRTISADDFFGGYLTSTVEPDEVLVELRLPADGPTLGRAFGEVSRRHGDFATVGVAISVRTDASGTITDASVGFGGVASTPCRLDAVEAVLHGTRGEPAAIEEACAIVRRDLDPVGDIHGSPEYRRDVAVELVRSVAAEAVARSASRPDSDRDVRS
jgi:carbon-monoxide dehydrogenase medium subunit